MGDAADSTDDGADGMAPHEAPLADGSYDVFVIDAEQGAQDPGKVFVEVTLIDGEHKGEVLSVGCPTAELLADDGDPIELLGETGMLTVADGAPRFQLDR